MTVCLTQCTGPCKDQTPHRKKLLLLKQLSAQWELFRTLLEELLCQQRFSDLRQLLLQLRLKSQRKVFAKVRRGHHHSRTPSLFLKLPKEHNLSPASTHSGLNYQPPAPTILPLSKVPDESQGTVTVHRPFSKYLL